MKKARAVEAAVGGQDLNAVIDAFKRWRDEKRPGEKIPQGLWQAAVSLHPRYSVYQISRALHLDFVDLRDRVGSGKKVRAKGEKGAQFVQLPMAMGGGGVADCRVKVRGGGKVRITVKLRAAAPGTVLELLRELWSRGA